MHAWNELFVSLAGAIRDGIEKKFLQAIAMEISVKEGRFSMMFKGI